MICPIRKLADGEAGGLDAPVKARHTLQWLCLCATGGGAEGATSMTKYASVSMLSMIHPDLTFTLTFESMLTLTFAPAVTLVYACFAVLTH